MSSIKEKQYFEEGQAAGARGKSLDHCPYRKAERKSAWVRGYHEGKLMSQHKPVLPTQRLSNNEHIANLRGLLNNKGHNNETATT